LALGGRVQRPAGGENVGANRWSSDHPEPGRAAEVQRSVRFPPGLQPRPEEFGLSCRAPCGVRNPEFADDLGFSASTGFAFHRRCYWMRDGPAEPGTRWAMQKFKRLPGNPTRAWRWQDAPRKRQPTLFLHRYLPASPRLTPTPDHGSRLSGDCHVRFGESGTEVPSRYSPGLDFRAAHHGGAVPQRRRWLSCRTPR
jgi:hypothetical protein